MGLLNKIKNVTGLVKNRFASSIGVLKTASPALKGAAKAAPLVSAAVSAMQFSKKLTGSYTVAGILSSPVKSVRNVRSVLSGKSGVQSSATVAPTGAAIMGGKSLGSRLKAGFKKHPLLATAAGTAAVAGLAFAGEQLLERAGVRGGAGLIGRRPRKSRKKRRARGVTSRRRSTRRRSRGGRRVSFTTRDGRRVSFTPRTGGRRRGRLSTLRYRRRSRGSRGVSKGELRSIRALIRRSERD